MTLSTIQVLFGIHLDAELFPILHHEITNGLKKIGFEISPGWPERVPVISRISGQGDIARKGKTIIRIDTSSKQILIVDDTLTSLFSNFSDVYNMFNEEYNLDFNDILKYYTFTGDYIYYAEKPAYKTLSNKLKLSHIKEISKIMGHDLSTFQINLAITDLKVNSDTWYDFIIRPNYERDDSYIIRVVIRNPSREVINKMITNFEEKIKDVINLIEA